MRRRGVYGGSVAALGFALALVAGACSILEGDDDPDAAVADAPIASMAEWEALWASERAATVKQIIDNGWGWDQSADRVTGPGGLEVDLTACPEGWDPYQGLTGGTINLGQVLALSGSSADDGNLAVGQAIYFDHINRQGGITDSTGATYRIVTDVRDDAAEGSIVQPVVDELLEAEGSFVIQTSRSHTTRKVYDRLHDECVPDPFVMRSAHPGWGAPDHRPWVWGQDLALTTEGFLWGGLIEQLFADRDKVTVGAVITDQTGFPLEFGFTRFIDSSELEIDLEVARIRPDTRTVTDELAALASQDLDVLIVMAAFASCTQVVTEVAAAGMKDGIDLLLLPSACRDERFVGPAAVGGDGSAAEGWWSLGGGTKDLADPALADDPWVAFSLDLLEASGHPITESPSLGAGFRYAWPLVEALRIAAQLPGGLSRPNLLVAARTMDMTNPMLLDGISYRMSGNDDVFLIEGSEVAAYDSSAQHWVTQEDLGVIELGGRTSSCAWTPDDAELSCR